MQGGRSANLLSGSDSHAAQVAARAQRASVEACEIVRYEEYDAKHGACYVEPGGEGVVMDEEDW